MGFLIIIILKYILFCYYLVFIFSIDMHQINAIENPAHRLDEHDFDHLEATDGWYDDVDDFGEPPDDGAMVDDQSDISDFEDSLKGRKRKKAREIAILIKMIYKRILLV